MSASADAEQPAKKGAAWLLLMFKAAVTVALISWLVQSDALNFSRLSLLVSSLETLLVTAATWLGAAVLLSTARWRLLLRTVHIEVPWLRAAGLQTMALFFNGLVPGNIGGDFLKNHAVLGKKEGARLVVMVVLERSLGVVSLIWTSGLGIVLSLDLLGDNPRLLALVLSLLGLMAASIIVPWLLFSRLPRGEFAPSSRPTEKNPSVIGRIAGAFRGTIHSVLRTLVLVRDAKMLAFKAFAISFVMHICNVMFFWYLTRLLDNPDATYAQVALAFPTGMLTLILPISISGMGVGHAAFNWLFGVLGLKNGADAFNLYLVGILSPCILGAIPYLFMRSSQKGLKREGHVTPLKRSS